jgi:very-short-patch-repair endonuclease
VTGLAALRRYKLRVPDSRTVNVLISASRNRVATGFVVPHRTTRMPRRFGSDGPIRFAVPARAVADAARGLGKLSDVRAVAAAAVQQDSCTVAELAEELDNGPHRWSGRLRMALAEVQAGVRSAAEADLYDLIGRSGLPVPMFNPQLIVDGQLLAVPDAWWPQAGLVVEVDSREWHLAPADWEATMRRHAQLTAHGVLVLHFSPRQIRTEPGVVVAAIQNALRVGKPISGITARPAP